MRHYLRVALLTARVQLQQLAVEGFIWIVVLAQPFAVAVAALYMLRHRPDFEATYVVVGSGLSGILSVVIFSGSWALANERLSGNLELLEAAPVPLFVIVAGKMLGNLALSLGSMVVSYGIAAWLFGYPMAVRQPLAFAVSLVLALVALWAMGVLLAPLAVLWPAAERLLSGTEYPVYILGGFLFPVALLPVWLLPVSYALPPYWAAQALHGAARGTLPLAELALAWLFLLVSSAVALALAAWLFRVLLVRARRQGLLAAV